MPRRFYTTGRLTDAQIALIYATAERLKIGVVLWQNTPAPDRSSFKWAVEGGVFAVWKFLKFLAALGQVRGGGVSVR